MAGLTTENALFYTADEPHGLPYDPFKAIIAPRPIGWIGSTDKQGRPNLAPYSFFNAVASRPNMIAFSSEGLKDSARNVRDTGEFTFSLATLPLAEQMNLSSASLREGENEFELARLTMAPSRSCARPSSPRARRRLNARWCISSSCAISSGEPTGKFLIIGQVVATHIKDEFIRDGRFDAVKAQSIARCGYNDYATLDAQWELIRPLTAGFAGEPANRLFLRRHCATVRMLRLMRHKCAGYGRQGETHMKMSGDKILNAPQARVWAALNDPEVLRQSIPGCESFEKQADGSYRATVAAKIGPVQARFNGTVQAIRSGPAERLHDFRRRLRRRGGQRQGQRQSAARTGARAARGSPGPPTRRSPASWRRSARG